MQNLGRRDRHFENYIQADKYKSLGMVLLTVVENEAKDS
jgi:hypothetical protein